MKVICSFTCKPGPDSGPDCLICAKFARLRPTNQSPSLEGVWAVEGLGFGVWGVGFEVWSLGFQAQGVECRVQGLGFRVRVSGFRVQDLGFRVSKGVPSAQVSDFSWCVGFRHITFMNPKPLKNPSDRLQTHRFKTSATHLNKFHPDECS